MKRAPTLFGARFAGTKARRKGDVYHHMRSMKSSHFGARMGLLNRMCCGEPPSARLIPACDGYRPARRTLFAPRRQYPYGHPRHARRREASEKYAADALIVEADISGNETPFSNLPLTHRWRNA